MKTEQISVSTADEERNYFSGSVQAEVPTQSGSAMPTGIYRVVDGSLFQVLSDGENRRDKLAQAAPCAGAAVSDCADSRERPAREQ